MQLSPGAVGKGHFVINILTNQIIWTVEMGWMVAHGQACWRGRAVAVVILGFCFVLNLGDCGLMGVGRFFLFFFFWPFFFFFFLKLLPQLFQAANVYENNNSLHTPTETIVIRSDSGKTRLAVPKATELKGLGISWGVGGDCLL